MSQGPYYIGIDVGTGSVRAGLVKLDGTLVASRTEETITWRDPEDHRIFEQSTTNIWAGMCKCIKACLEEAKVSPSEVKGLGFDATCSLAVSDMNGDPVIVTKGADLGQSGERNIILWADHRAEKEAELINSTGSVVLDYVGGTMSLEMEIPKTLWLKRHMKPELFKRCQFFDLPDFLTYRATDTSNRSCCSIACKCSYVPTKDGWQPEFFEKIGLGEFVENGFNQLGHEEVLTAGMPIGKGLSRRAAEEMGLVEGTPVGSGVIDAYAGWLGTVAARYKSRHRLAAVAGTSTCHIVQSPEGVFDVVFPGWWMNEGGQSSTGQLIDFMITTHAAYPRLKEVAAERKTNIHDVLHDELERLRSEVEAENLTELTKDLHFYPDLHDPRMTGSIVGMKLDSTLSDLARKFNVTLEAIALQTRHIVDQMNAKGHEVRSIYMSGGQAKNAMLMQLFANTCAIPVVLPENSGAAVVLGAAMLGRFAAEAAGHTELLAREKRGQALWEIMVEMTPAGTMVEPAASPKEKKLLQAKYKIFLEAIELQRRWRKEMEEANN
ncbi:Pentulose kinase [Epithele typhae]|uniref:Pentulose kinase n=1 Tax=Epithele typhae TaxID=378194 RepID=UPI0020082E25|nr:Pentulose kinase [Epithele typhae]KAH9921515.1 Pentulose kinase [Epithele typhae]